MSSPITTTTTTTAAALAYYGVGILGIFSLASLGMNKVFGCGFIWPWSWTRSLKRLSRHHRVSSEDFQVLQHALSERDTEIMELRKALSTATAQATATSENHSHSGQCNNNHTNASKTSTSVERELEDARKEIERMNRRRMDLEKQTREALVKKETLENELVERDAELGLSRENAERVQESLEHTKTLLDARTSELKFAVAEAFLSRSADRYAGADIMRMIETLNSEIRQAASIMADVFSPDLQQQPRKRNIHEAVAHTEEILGEGMTKILETFNHQEDNIILQIAFQASMCAFTEWIMDSWCYHDRDSEVELVLQETYEQLRETGNVLVLTESTF